MTWTKRRIFTALTGAALILTACGDSGEKEQSAKAPDLPENTFVIENARIFDDVAFGFRVSFLNKCDELERGLVAEFYQRCFGEELPESTAHVALA